MLHTNRVTTATLALACLFTGGAERGLRGASLALSSESRLSVDLSGKRVPNWSGGTLNLVEDEKTSAPTVHSFDRHGQVVSKVVFTIPGATSILVRGFTRGLDGTVALCGTAIDAAGRASSYVGWVSPNGDTQVVRTSPYVAVQVGITSDGSIWTQGLEYLSGAERKKGKSIHDPRSAVFRRFDRSGWLAGSFVPQSEFRELLSLSDVITTGFGATGDGVVWYSSRERACIHVASTGVVTRIDGLPPPNEESARGFAITGDGSLFVSSRGRSGATVSRLDPAARAWVPLHHVQFENHPHPDTYLLYGADGDQLVAARPWADDGIRHVRFLRAVQ